MKNIFNKSTKSSIEGAVDVFLEKENLSSSDALYESIKGIGYEIDRVLVSEGDYFVKGQAILTFPRDIRFFFLPYNGIVKRVCLGKGDYFGVNKKALVVEKTDLSKEDIDLINLEKRNFEDHISICESVDDFTDDRIVKYCKVVTEPDDHLKIYLSSEHGFDQGYLGISFINENGGNFLSFCTNLNISLRKDDSMILLFEDKTRMKLQFNDDYSIAQKNYVPLFESTLESLLKKNLLKLRLEYNKGKNYSVFDMDHKYIYSNPQIYDKVGPQYISRVEGQYLLRLMAYKFTQYFLSAK